MASLDEIFSSMEDMDGAEDNALDFLIDENLRVISVPEQGVVLGVEGDKDVNRVRFRMSRYYHETDLSEFDIRINYQNAEGDRNYFEVTEKNATEDSLSFIWTVAADASLYKGEVWFVVYCLKASEDGTVDKAYHTTIGKASVLEGLDVDEQADQPTVQDLLLNLKHDLTTHAEGLMENAKTEAKAAAEEASAAAEESAKAAKASETKSAASEANALKSAQNANSSATAASSSAQAAKTSATNADSSAKAAGQSEANAKIYSERAQAISDGYKGWYQTGKDLEADLTSAKNGDWAIVGEDDTIWVWDSDTGAWKNSVQKADLSDYLTQTQIKKLLENYMPLRAATSTTLGGVKLSDDFTADEDGTLRLAGGTAPEPYPVAGIKVGKGLTVSTDGILSVTSSSNPLDAYPVGSIYQTTDLTSPASLFGGSWEQIANSRVLMGAPYRGYAGRTVEAGLPNITGTVRHDNNDHGMMTANSGNTSGSFYAGASTAGKLGTYSGTAYELCFDASRSSAVYGGSSTVQPAAYYVYIWHRVA